ncbi:methyltransferase domain-containing protein [Streptomyces sp. CAU 1734]|uniref:class I SAM-dependent methyltransferase n=1 Tax=Streptomyces sp. CAU 1734 TaxID=3140360 RepID=UPI0032605AC9
MPPPPRALRARSFDPAAARYDAARPGYPQALLDAVEELTGRPIRGSRVVDVGAGTGISTRLLHARGARVTAVEPGPGMAAQFRRGLPSVPLVRGIGDALPLAAGSADLITYAQSWHWTDPARSIPEALRVLAPGGALALWWNIADRDVPWIREQAARLAARFTDSAHGAPPAARRFPDELPSHTRTVRWSRTVPLAVHLENLGSHSLFLTVGQETAADFLDRERAELLAAFPGGTVREEYETELAVTIRPGTSFSR